MDKPIFTHIMEEFFTQVLKNHAFAVNSPFVDFPETDVFAIGRFCSSPKRTSPAAESTSLKKKIKRMLIEEFADFPEYDIFSVETEDLVPPQNEFADFPEYDIFSVETEDLVPSQNIFADFPEYDVFSVETCDLAPPEPEAGDLFAEFPEADVFSIETAALLAVQPPPPPPPVPAPRALDAALSAMEAGDLSEAYWECYGHDTADPASGGGHGVYCGDLFAAEREELAAAAGRPGGSFCRTPDVLRGFPPPPRPKVAHARTPRQFPEPEDDDIFSY